MASARCSSASRSRVGAEHADRESRPGERLAHQELLVDPRSRPTRAHLVLEELAQRLDEREAHPLGQPAHVVMALDGGRGPAHRDRLDDVRVERALRQEVEVAELLRFSSKTSMKVAPMIFRFCSGS
jgi:hypothetical protein